MKLPNLHIFRLITDAVNIITSRKQLKQFLTTPLYSNAIYLMASIAGMALLGFFFWVVVARFYTESEVGYSAAIISVINLLAILSLVGADSSLIRFLPQAEKPKELINSFFTLTSLISLVIAGIFVAGVDFWSPALAFIKGTAIFAAAFIVFTPLYALLQLANASFVASRRAGFMASTNIIFSALKIPFPILFVSLFHSFGVVASWGIAAGTAMVISLFLFLPKAQSHYKPVPTLKLNLIKKAWRYSGGNYLTSLFIISPTLVLPVMVVNLLGPEQNAYFYIAWMMATLLFAIPLGVSQSLFAEGSHFEDKLKKDVIKSVKFTFLILIPAVILLNLVGKWLLLAFGQGYSLNALLLLRILTISSLPLAINFIYTSVLRVTHRIRELVAIWGFITIAMLVVSFLVIPSTGITGIGYIWLGVQSAVAIYVTAIRRKLLYGSY